MIDLDASAFLSSDDTDRRCVQVAAIKYGCFKLKRYSMAIPPQGDPCRAYTVG